MALSAIYFFKLFFLSRLTQSVFKRVDEVVGLFKKFQNGLRRTSLIKIYKSFIGPYVDYGDVIYGQRNNFALEIRVVSV